MKLAVIGGTPVDTQMGCELIESRLVCQTIPISVSTSPKEQTTFQTSSPQEKNTYILELLKQAKNQNVSGVCIYCNSLSASVSFDELAQKIALPIITPFSTYRTLAKKYKKIGILAANAQGAAGIEREIIQSNPEITVYSVTNLKWVDAVEQKLEPEVIIQENGLEATRLFFEQVNVDCILIGCTHFPYFLTEYQQKTPILCINPDEMILEELQAL